MAIKVRSRRLPLAVLMCAAVVSTLCVGSAAAAEMEPTLKLMSARSKVQVPRYRGHVSIDIGAYLASLDAPFELRVKRPVYSEPLVLTQIVQTDSDPVERLLDPSLLAGWAGLSQFFRFQVKDLQGNVLRTRKMTFCPGMGPRERVNDDGPMATQYPEGCYANPFSIGMVWGIESGWAASLAGWDGGINMKLPEGRFDATINITKPYRELFNVVDADSSITARIIVKDQKGGCRHCFHREGSPEEVKTTGTPEMLNPDPQILPDLKSFPAWGIRLQRRKDGKEFLNFGATVWTAGASSLVVEGFRKPSEDVMDAYQYFYENGEVVGRAPVGSLEYDDRRGHEHWHFLQFAGYSLTDKAQEHIVRSKKEAFCLAPTDAVDMTLPNADWNPYSIGHGSSCGTPGSLWVREVLALGWGDTYSQSRPGQSFNVTNLPNGTYHIKVEANPGGNLYEQDLDNNVEYRKVILKGKPGRRYVRVPPWNGIDSESGWEYYYRSAIR